jgi:HK97 family phage portal protein
MGLFDKKQENQPVKTEPIEKEINYNTFLNNSEIKSYSYNDLLNAETQAFRNEFIQGITKDTLSNLLTTQATISKALNVIAKQFQNTNFVSENDKGELISNPKTELLNNPKSQPAAIFYSNLIMDLMLTGEAFILPDIKNKILIRIPSRSVTIQAKGLNKIDYTVVGDNGSSNVYTQDELIPITLPNPLSYGKGLSPLVGALIPMINDKYAQEFITSYFIRGGSAEMILGTKEKAGEQLQRLLVSLMTKWSGRSNIRTHKLIPADIKLVGQGETLGQSKIVENLKEFERAIISHLGVPPVLVGQTDGSNYANSVEQMRAFWVSTILPLQKLIESCINESSLFAKEVNKVKFNNEGNPYLSDYQQRLTDDSKLKELLTINERRKLLGFEPIEGGDEIPTKSSSVPTDIYAQAFNPAKGLKKKSLNKKPVVPQNVKDVYKNEFRAWESIILENHTNKEKAFNIIKNRNDTFALKMQRVVKPFCMKEYMRLMKPLMKKVNREIFTKSVESDKRQRVLEQLTQRADNVLGGAIATRSRDYFVGYSENEVNRVYEIIDRLINENASLDDIASAIRTRFGEFYQGQATTIMRTEFLTSTALGFGQFENDMAEVADTLEKEWLTLEDERTRDSHIHLDGEIVKYTAGEDAYFSNGLRYPRDSKGDAGEIINCRCSVDIRIVTWKF